MNLAVGQNWLRNLNPIGYFVFYFAIMAGTAAVWLTNGTVVGSVAGGLFFGLGMSLKIGTGIKDKILAEILSPLFIFLAFGLSIWKEQSLMPETWDPAGYQDGVGVGFFVVGLWVAFLLAELRKPEHVKERERAEREIEEAMEKAESENREGEDVKPSTYLWLAQSYSAVALISAVLLTVSTLRPDWFGTYEQAMTRYVRSSIYDFKNKEHLDRWLALNTEVTVTSSFREGKNMVAKIKVISPVVPFDIGRDQINSKAEKNKYLDLPESQQPYVEQVGTVVFEPSGLRGWSVSKAEGFTADPLKLASDYKAGRLKSADRVQMHAWFMSMTEFIGTSALPLTLITGMIALVATLLLSSPWVMVLLSSIALFTSTSGVVGGLLTMQIL